jgi:hypothetical protein
MRSQPVQMPNFAIPPAALPIRARMGATWLGNPALRIGVMARTSRPRGSFCVVCEICGWNRTPQVSTPLRKVSPVVSGTNGRSIAPENREVTTPCQPKYCDAGSPAHPGRTPKTLQHFVPVCAVSCLLVPGKTAQLLYRQDVICLEGSKTTRGPSAHHRGNTVRLREILVCNGHYAIYNRRKPIGISFHEDR